MNVLFESKTLGSLKQDQLNNIKDILSKCAQINKELKFSPGRYLRMISYILGTVKHETNHSFRPVQEAYYIKNPTKRRNALIHYYSKGKGRNHKKTILVYRDNKLYLYTGNGYVQITHVYNYDWADEVTGYEYNLVAQPENARLPHVAAEILVQWFFNKHLKEFKRYVHEEAWDLYNLRNIVNLHDKWRTIGAYSKKILNSLSVDKVQTYEKLTLLDKGTLSIAKVLELYRKLSF